MATTASDLMQREPSVASPLWDVAELERAFFAEGCSGFPVVRDGELVGVVSRSDLVRRLALQHSHQGMVSDFFREFGSQDAKEESSIRRGETRALAENLTGCTVADLMSPPTYVVDADAPVQHIAELLVRHHIHRVPVVTEGKLVGIVSSLDLVALLAEPT